MTDTGAQAVIRDGKIEISVAVANLPMIVSGSCASLGMNGLWKVTDPEAFAKDVCRALNAEDGCGSTHVHIMFDKAFDPAIDQGAEGVEEVTEEEFERLFASFRALPRQEMERSDQQTESESSRALSPLPNVPVDGRLRAAQGLSSGPEIATDGGLAESGGPTRAAEVGK